MPSLPSTGKGAKTSNNFEIMPSIKKVADYGNFSIREALDLPCDMFLLMSKNSIVDEMNKTEEGREYLAKCERLAVKEIDLDGLEKNFNVKEVK